MRKRFQYWSILWAIIFASPAVTRSEGFAHFCEGQRMKVLGLIVGESNFQNAKDRFGNIDEYRIGEKESDPRYLCYKIPAANTPLVLQLESGPLGGAERTITGYSISSADAKNKCRFVTSVLAGKLTNLGITTGDSVTQIIRKLGVPDTKSGNQLTYQCNSRRPMTDEEVLRTESTFGSIPASQRYFDFKSTLRLSLIGKRIKAISLRQTETY